MVAISRHEDICTVSDNEALKIILSSNYWISSIQPVFFWSDMILAFSILVMYTIENVFFC